MLRHVDHSYANYASWKKILCLRLKQKTSILQNKWNILHCLIIHSEEGYTIGSCILLCDWVNILLALYFRPIILQLFKTFFFSNHVIAPVELRDKLFKLYMKNQKPKKISLEQSRANL